MKFVQSFRPLLPLALVGAALAPAVPAHAQPASAVALSAAEKAAAREIRPEQLRAHVRFLSDDLLEGRGPGTRGDLLAQRYIASQMEGLGLEPGAEGGWFQPFDLVGISSQNPATVAFRRGGQSVTLRHRDDFIAFSGVAGNETVLPQSELVFVGYGIVAPEYGWDDYKDVSVKGKVVLVMNNDPAGDPALFAGKSRLYYGRWSYKYEEALRHGAAGAIIIHTTPSAGYPWQVVQTSWTGAQFALPDEGAAQLLVKAWVTEEAARKLTTLGGQDLEALRAAAEKKDFRAVPLGVTAGLRLTNEVQRVRTANVLGRLPGRDPALSPQVVVYTAHHDHLGLREGAKAGEDAIFNGALDNASGVASLLAIARAIKSGPPPRRSILFAAVAAEEQGLLGSKYLAAHPPVPAGRIAANINIDSTSIWGRTRDVIVVGFGKSSLDRLVVGLAKLQGRVVLPDQAPDKGYFYRSDQFSFARIGVPATYCDAGLEVVGKPPGWGKQQQDAYEATHYHQPSDELRPDWDFSGAVEDAQLLLYLGLKVANTTALPAWNPGDEFEAARKKALSEVK